MERVSDPFFACCCGKDVASLDSWIYLFIGVCNLYIEV
jgi:hypothetical protein